jgi:hypothetical protein
MTNFPPPELTQETVKATTSYIDTAAWIEKLSLWGKGFADVIRSTILDLIGKGAGPRAIASKVRQYAESMPKHAAETLMRTLQNKAYQQAARETEKLNGRFIRGRIRIATLGPNCCLTCVALHGTELKPDEELDDHFSGKCSTWYRVLGGPDFPDQMQADSTPGNRKFVPWQTGEEWFSGLSPERQQQQASFKATPAKYKAYLDGHPLSEFVGEHVDPVFGRMTIEESLKGMFGEDAEKYYIKPSGTVRLGKQEWINSLSEEEINALHYWGISGRNIRNIQSGNIEGISERELKEAKNWIKYYENAISRGIKYNGTVYRGLTNVPNEIIDEWINNGFITLGNDQSSTSLPDVARGFGISNAGTKYKNALWRLDQESGINLFGKTNVTMGGKSIDESEIILRKGMKYKINNYDFVITDGKDKGKKFSEISNTFFEGTDYNYPNNMPDKFNIGEFFNGYYEINMTEVTK